MSAVNNLKPGEEEKIPKVLPNRQVKIMTQNHNIKWDTLHGKLNPNKHIGNIFQIQIKA